MAASALVMGTRERPTGHPDSEPGVTGREVSLLPGQLPTSDRLSLRVLIRLARW